MRARRTHMLSLLSLATLLLPFAGWQPLRAAEDKGAQVDTQTADDTWTMPKDLMLRVRVTAITPNEPTHIEWRWGGEGLGGKVSRGTLAEKLPVGEWSPAVPVASLVRGQFPGKLFLTFMVGQSGRLKPRPDGGSREMEGGSKNAEVEFEFSFQGTVVKTFKEAGPDGGTVGIVIPAYRLAGGPFTRTPASPEFLGELCGLLEYATKRAGRLEALPWAKKPLPKLYAIVTDLGGYGSGIYYGIRTTNKAVVEADCRSLRQLGVNGLRNCPAFLAEMVQGRQGIGTEFTRIRDLGIMGYPVPSAQAGRAAPPEAGCPFAPGVAARTKEGIEQALGVLKLRADEVWGLTVDEIGSVYDRAPEGKEHLALCPLCAEGFRAYLKGIGIKPADLGKTDWPEVRPVNLWAKPQSAGGSRQEAVGAKKEQAKEAAELEETKKSAGASEKPEPKRPAWQTDPQTALLAYYTATFPNYASARLFIPLRDAYAQANDRKRQAVAAGDANSPAAQQPWVYSYALRGNTFLMGGHSLDFFEFYRHADNGFVYETSNREPRIWSWDSYLCDVGRVVTGRNQLRFGIYIKPHRGAPIQRMLAAISRGARMIYWYTYGPDYAKGDSFSQNWDDLVTVSRAARLLGGAEAVLYGSSWLRPAEVAVVFPRSSEIWMRLGENAPARQAAWENAKWLFTALAHAHISVDPLDEVMLTTEDLSRYKVIYVSGPNLTRAAAEALGRWVEAGGTLYTSGWGLVRDEANQPLASMLRVLGLRERGTAEMWYNVMLYGATGIEAYDEPGRVLAPVPDGARITGSGPFTAALSPVIGREVLHPADGTEVVARFADGGAAATRHRHGRGLAYVVGFFPGLEYSAGVRRHPPYGGQAPLYDMSKDFDAGRRSFVAAPALERVKPAVDAAQPTVEGILLRNESTGKRAVTLMNWAYRVAAHRARGPNAVSAAIVPLAFEDLTVTVRGAGPVNRVLSVALEKELTLSRSEDTFSVVLPRLDEGDVLILE